MGLMRLEASAKNSSEKERMREPREAEARSRDGVSVKGPGVRWEGTMCTYTVRAEGGINCIGGDGVTDGLRGGLDDCGEEALYIHCAGRRSCA